jgi:hypothetical protein
MRKKDAWDVKEFEKYALSAGRRRIGIAAARRPR